MKSVLLASTALLVATVFVPGAHAQTASTNTQTGMATNTLGTVTVTAERRKSNLQKTAASITVLNGANLANEGRDTLAQILEDVPGVTGGTGLGIPSDNPGSSVIIRGVPSDPAGPGGSVVSSTAAYVDGIYEGIDGDFDIDRVEVLRGPQGTLYGRSATSGVVSTYTRNPVLGKLSADVTGEYGSYDLRHVQAAVNIPILPQIALRLSGNQIDEHGVISEVGGKSETQELRAKLLYRPTDNLSLLVGWALNEDHDNSGGASIYTFVNQPNRWYVQSGQGIYPTETHERQYWAQGDWTTAIGTLTYIPAFHTYNSTGQQLIQGFIDQVSTEPLDQFMTHEVRLTSLDDSPIKWVVGGLFYYNQQSSVTSPHWVVSGAPVWEAATSKQTRDMGVFAEATYPIWPTWRITGGVRYDNTRVQTSETYTQNLWNPADHPGLNPFSPGWFLPADLVSASVGGAAGLRQSDNVTFKARVEKDVTPSNMLYAMIATGFLPADISTNEGANGPVVIPYEQEKLTSFELGSKNRFFDNRLQLNGDVYYYDYTGYQQGTNLQTSTAPNAPPIFGVLQSPAHMFGYEVEGAFLATPIDRFNLAIGHINATFVNTPNTTTDPFSTYIAQRTVPGIAPMTIDVSYNHDFDLPDGSSFTFRDQVRYTSGYDAGALTYYDLNEGAGQYVHIGDQVVDDINLGWNAASGKLNATFYVDNVGDAVYKTGAVIQSITPSAGGTPAQIQGTLGLTTPRTYGLVIHASY